jgi:hypothetical protein
MSNPPNNPFNDDDGYYARDPKAIVTRTDEQLRAFLTHVLALAAGVVAMGAALPPEQRVLIEKLQGELHAVQDSTTLLMALVRELSTYNHKLTAQRRSARDAYNAGWKDRYEDILSQLHPADHRMLRWIVEHLDAGNDEDETDQRFDF